MTADVGRPNPDARFMLFSNRFGETLTLFGMPIVFDSERQARRVIGAYPTCEFELTTTTEPGIDPPVELLAGRLVLARREDQ